MTTHRLAHRISFQDCDPAGIVFYPRFFALFDRTFHDWLRQFGGHAALCKQLGAIGLGLISADAVFRSPARDGDDVVVEMSLGRWGGKSLTLNYAIRCQEQVVATGLEVRGVFQTTPDGLRAGGMDRLKALVTSQ